MKRFIAFKNFVQGLNYDRTMKTAATILAANVILLVGAIALHRNTAFGIAVLIATVLVSGPTSVIAFWRIRMERGDDNV